MTPRHYISLAIILAVACLGLWASYNYGKAKGIREGAAIADAEHELERAGWQQGRTNDRPALEEPIPDVAEREATIRTVVDYGGPPHDFDRGARVGRDTLASGRDLTAAHGQSPEATGGDVQGTGPPPGNYRNRPVTLTPAPPVKTTNPLPTGDPLVNGNGSEMTISTPEVATTCQQWSLTPDDLALDQRIDLIRLAGKPWISQHGRIKARTPFGEVVREFTTQDAAVDLWARDQPDPPARFALGPRKFRNWRVGWSAGPALTYGPDGSVRAGVAIVWGAQF